MLDWCSTGGAACGVCVPYRVRRAPRVPYRDRFIVPYRAVPYRDRAGMPLSGQWARRAW